MTRSRTPRAQNSCRGTETLDRGAVRARDPLLAREPQLPRVPIGHAADIGESDARIFHDHAIGGDADRVQPLRDTCFDPGGDAGIAPQLGREMRRAARCIAGAARRRTGIEIAQELVGEARLPLRERRKRGARRGRRRHRIGRRASRRKTRRLGMIEDAQQTVQRGGFVEQPDAPHAVRAFDDLGDRRAIVRRQRASRGKAHMLGPPIGKAPPIGEGDARIFGDHALGRDAGARGLRRHRRRDRLPHRYAPQELGGTHMRGARRVAGTDCRFLAVEIDEVFRDEHALPRTERGSEGQFGHKNPPAARQPGRTDTKKPGRLSAPGPIFPDKV